MRRVCLFVCLPINISKTRGYPNLRRYYCFRILDLSNFLLCLLWLNNLNYLDQRQIELRCSPVWPTRSIVERNIIDCLLLNDGYVLTVLDVPLFRLLGWSIKVFSFPTRLLNLELNHYDVVEKIPWWRGLQSHLESKALKF